MIGCRNAMRGSKLRPVYPTHPEDMKTESYRKNRKALQRIKKSFQKYDLTLRAFECRFDRDDEVYVYRIVAARRNSGSRGGHRRNNRCWYLTNLWPDQRAFIESLPTQLNMGRNDWRVMMR